MSARRQHEKKALESEDEKQKRMLGQDAKRENERKQPDRREI